MDYLQLMEGAGLGDVLIPKKEFIKEHERLVALLNQSDIPALRKEAKEQKAELVKRGGSINSNFIARLMAEAKYKHREPSQKHIPYDKNSKQPGKYVNHSVMDPEDEDTTMSQPIKFEYDKIANKNQVPTGENNDGNPYGASPFITYHFGHARMERKPNETRVQAEARKEFNSAMRRKEAALERRGRKRAALQPREEEEEMSAAEKREAAKEAYRERRRAARYGDNVRLPESQKRKERRDRQAAAKRQSDAARRAEVGEREAERAEAEEKAERARKREADKKARYERSVAKEPKGFLSAADKEPRSRPANISKSQWLQYLSSKAYQDLVEQRDFNMGRRR